jgi:hypothetical protein
MELASGRSRHNEKKSKFTGREFGNEKIAYYY